MSVTLRTATLVPFAARVRTAPGVAAARTVRAPARGRVARPASPVVASPVSLLRRAAAAAGLGAMLLASVGGAGWAFVAAEQATRSSLASYVAAPGGGLAASLATPVSLAGSVAAPGSRS